MLDYIHPHARLAANACIHTATSNHAHIAIITTANASDTTTTTTIIPTTTTHVVHITNLPAHGFTHLHSSFKNIKN